jgi:hypothetical protein
MKWSQFATTLARSAHIAPLKIKVRCADLLAQRSAHRLHQLNLAFEQIIDQRRQVNSFSLRFGG